MTSSRTDRVTGLGAAVAVKAPVLVASTGNITSLSSAQTVDGVATSSGDRVLVWQQTDASENGIYEIATTWGRTKDFDGSNEVVRGTVVQVNAGTTYSGNWYKVTSTGDNIPGTDDISFAQASAPISLATLTGDIDTAGYVINHSEGAAVAADTTANIWNSSGNTVFVTGTAVIASLGEAPRAGAWRRTVFGASCAISHSTTSIFLDSTESIVTKANDVYDWYADSTSLIRLSQALPINRRVKTGYFEVDTSSTNTANTGVAFLNSGAESSYRIFLDRPFLGAEKDIYLQTSATEVFIDTDATATIIYTGDSAAGTTGVTFASNGFYGGYLHLVGLSSAKWLITNRSTHISS